MTYFKKTFELTEEEKRKAGEMAGKIITGILEERHVGYMAENLKLDPWMVEANIDEILCILRKRVGWRRYLKVLFWK